MSAVYGDGQWPDIWTVRDIGDGPGRMPLLLVPKNFSDDLDLDLDLQPGASRPTRLKFSHPLALYVDTTGAVSTCILSDTNDVAASVLRIDSVGEPNFGGSIDPVWAAQIQLHGAVLWCAYTDIFLAGHVGDNDEPDPHDMLRLLRTSLLGMIRVLGPTQ